jgi:hypothetical protein
MRWDDTIDIYYRGVWRCKIAREWINWKLRGTSAFLKIKESGLVAFEFYQGQLGESYANYFSGRVELSNFQVDRVQGMLHSLFDEEGDI